MKYFKEHELDKKIIICIWLIGIIVVLGISSLFFFLYSKRNEVYEVKYDEKSDLSYEVVLKENDYYEDTSMQENNQYIASLIDHIDANFNYDLDVKEDLNYNYKYKIVSDVNVIDNSTNRSIYTYSEDTLNEVTGESNGVLNINENINIDYNKYNDKISQFVKVYNLSNVTSKLTLKMYVGIDENLENLNKVDNPVITLDIPLTTNTIAIDVNYDLIENVDGLITLKPSYENSKMWFKFAIISLVFGLGLIGMLIKYIIDNRTEEDRYNGELRKILSNYGSYISKVEDEFNMDGYQILKVANFIDLLEIRDTIHNPIIMMENKEQCVTCFIIPTSNNILYFYSLGLTQYVLKSGEDENKEKVCTENIE